MRQWLRSRLRAMRAKPDAAQPPAPLWQPPQAAPTTAERLARVEREDPAHYAELLVLYPQTIAEARGGGSVRLPDQMWHARDMLAHELADWEAARG
jgi:hypothetical protein